MLIENAVLFDMIVEHYNTIKDVLKSRLNKSVQVTKYYTYDDFKTKWEDIKDEYHVGISVEGKYICGYRLIISDAIDYQVHFDAGTLTPTDISLTVLDFNGVAELIGTASKDIG
jgi:hypothetical protein